MRPNKIDQELWKARDQGIKECGGVHGLFESLREWERRHPKRMADASRIGRAPALTRRRRKPTPLSDALWVDPIVREVREARERLWRESGENGVDLSIRRPASISGPRAKKRVQPKQRKGYTEGRPQR